MRTGRRRMTLIATTAAATATLVTAGLLTSVSAQAAAGCQVAYTVASQWPGGFTGNVTVTNLGDPVTGWTLRWSYGAGQQVSQAWGATASQSGNQVSATNVDYNGSLATNASTTFGFNASWNNSSNPAPSGFTLNNVACTGGTTPTTPPPTTPPPSSTPPPSTQPPSTLVGWATQNGAPPVAATPARPPSATPRA
ncbi:cellulose binding domain-containing protein [Micromonospora vinacea]|uniref:cellulose binding domain-containing protein n=1 Tax=Micromonospora vinacea TaxID=709878 RepID=UPI0034539B57